MKNSIPRELQSVLWSQELGGLDLEKDKVYIIHQILAYGSLEDIRWLLQTYGKNDVIYVFTKRPYKDYSSSRFSFIKTLVLPLKSFPLNPKRYVKNIPRDIR